jgi:hypothetical protein
VRDQPLALFGGIELAELLKGWSDDLVLCTDGATLSEDESRLLSKNNIAIREERIVRVEGKNGQLENIVFAKQMATKSSNEFAAVLRLLTGAVQPPICTRTVQGTGELAAFAWPRTDCGLCADIAGPGTVCGHAWPADAD